MIGEVRNTIEKIEKEHYDKFGYDKYAINCGYDVNIKSSIEYFDNLKNITKIFWVEGYKVMYGARRWKIASKHRYKVIKVNKMIITIDGVVRKNIVKTYLDRRIPMLWRKFLINIANNRDFVYN